LKEAALARLKDVQNAWTMLPPVGTRPSLAKEWLDDGAMSRWNSQEMIEDTLEYIEWAVAWPAATKAVREFSRGLKIDA
jgi:hypothetical protein